jgi:hypothetical protein
VFSVELFLFAPRAGTRQLFATWGRSAPETSASLRTGMLLRSCLQEHPAAVSTAADVQTAEKL